MSLADGLLAAIRTAGLRLPDAIRPALADSPLRPDLYFDLSGGPLCVFCDGEPPPAETLALRAELEDLGYRVISAQGIDATTISRIAAIVGRR